MATVQNPKWTPQHDDALAALLALKVPKKEAQKALEGMQEADSGELVKAMLRSRSKGLGRAPVAPMGGPQNAMPINPPTPAAATTQARPSILRSFVPKPPQIAATVAPQVPRINLRAFTPQPSNPAAAQIQPQTPAAPAPEKPRIRIRAAGGRVPAAPLGGATPSIGQPSPTNAPVTPSKEPEERKFIWTDAEYEKLAPGAKFIWGPNGRKYTKPAEGGE